MSDGVWPFGLGVAAEAFVEAGGADAAGAGAGLLWPSGLGDGATGAAGLAATGCALPATTMIVGLAGGA
jgi:hypothetical protein